MPLFPKIQSPCPYKGRLSDIMDGDLCRLCKREVVDLTDMGDQDRLAFFAACSDQVCVSYSLRPALAAAGLVAMLGAPSAAAGQDAAAPVPQATDFPAEEIMIFVGGITDPANVQFVEAPEDASVPELPVTYEETQEPAEPRDGPGRADERPARETTSPGS
jgi:hypothetical protein